MTQGNASNTISGRTAFLSLLHSQGVTTLFGNPGTTELPIMHALTEQTEMGYVLALQESVVVAMADGYARASGKLAACNVHVAPGLGNAMGALYTSYVSGTPLIITAGQQEQGHGLTEPLLYAPLVPMATPVVKWAVEVNRIEDLPRIVHRAAKVAMTAPTGPVFISLPGDILNAHAPLELGAPTHVDTASRPTDAALRTLAERLLATERPVLLAGHELVTSDALAEAARLAEVLGAPVFQQSVASGAHFLSEHPAYMGGVTRIQPRTREILSPYDTLVCLGSDVLRMSVYSTVDPLPTGMKVIQIGLRDWEMGKNYAADLAIRSDVKETLAALIPVLEEMGGEALRTRAAASLKALAGKNWTAQREVKRAAAQKAATQRPTDPDWLMMKLSELMPEDGMLVDEGITSTNNLLSFYAMRDRWGYFGNYTGGIGWALPAAVGAQLAQPDRRVVAVVGDGSAMYSIQALWSAANAKAPVIFIITNNGGYRVLKERLKAFHDNDRPIGMDFRDPPIDPAGLARSFGVRSERIEDPARFEPAFCEALAGNEPVLLDVIVQG